MPATSLSSLLIIGKDILGTQLNTRGSISAQIGDSVTGDAESNDCAYWQQVGFASRPSDAQSGKSSAQCLAFEQGDRDIIFATKDIRGQEIYGNLSAGETVMYAPGADGEGQAKVSLKGDGSVTLFTTDDNTSDGNGVYLRLDKNALSFIAPWGRMVFDKTGFHVEIQNGASLDLSGVNLPGPLAGMSSSAKISASIISVDGPSVLLGPSTLNGGSAFMAAAYGLLPPVAPGIPILGAGVGAVTVAAASSQHVLVAI